MCFFCFGSSDTQQHLVYGVSILIALCPVGLAVRSSYEWIVYFGNAFSISAKFQIDMYNRCHIEFTEVSCRNSSSNSKWVNMQVMTLFLCIC